MVSQLRLLLHDSEQVCECDFLAEELHVKAPSLSECRLVLVVLRIQVDVDHVQGLRVKLLE